MQIGGTTIYTPVDKWPGYDPAWRHLTARLWVSHKDWSPSGKYRFVGEDKWIDEHRAYLRALEDGITPPDRLMYHAPALEWFNERNMKDARFQIEPLLLTAVPYHIIWEDLCKGSWITGPTIMIFERLFFDCREADGRMVDAGLRRRWLALPQNAVLDGGTPIDLVWKNLAHVLGYFAIMREFGLPAHADMGDPKFLEDHMLGVFQSKMVLNVLRNTVSNRDMAEFHVAVDNHKRLLYDTGGSVDAAGEANEAMGDLLGKLAPVVLAATQSRDKQLAQDKAFISKVGSDPVVRQQGLIEAGAQEKGKVLDELLEVRMAAQQAELK